MSIRQRIFCGAVVGAYLTLFATGIYTTKHASSWCEAASTHIAAHIYAATQE